MVVSGRFLAGLTVGCAVAAVVFGVGSEVFASRFSVSGDGGRAQLILFARLAVLVVLGLVLVFRGGWWGVVAAVLMALAATFVEWAAFPFAYQFGLSQAADAGQNVPRSLPRPGYLTWALDDVIGVGIASALAQGLRIMAHVDPRATPRNRN